MADIILLPNGADFNNEKGVNVKTGTADTDLVNVKQLNDAIAAIPAPIRVVGNYDATLNAPDLVTPAPGLVKEGNLYVVTVAGTAFYGENLEIGDSVISKVDDPAALSDWIRVEKNKDAEDLATTLSAGNTSGGTNLIISDGDELNLKDSTHKIYFNNADTLVNYETNKGHKLKTGTRRLIVSASGGTSIEETTSGNIFLFRPDQDRFELISSLGFKTEIEFTPATINRMQTIQDKDGTIALTSDITGTNSGTNTGDVTLSGTPNYITIVGQTITRALISLTSHVTGILGIGNGGTGVTTYTALTAALDLFTSTLKGLVPASGGGTTNFLRADGTWAAPPSGTSSYAEKFGATITNSSLSTWQVRTLTGAGNNKLCEVYIDQNNNGVKAGVREVGSSLDRFVNMRDGFTILVKTNGSGQIEVKTDDLTTTYRLIGEF